MLLIKILPGFDFKLFIQLEIAMLKEAMYHIASFNTNIAFFHGLQC